MTGEGTTRGTVVVTGASRGIGRTIAMDLSDNGFLVFAGVRDPDDGESLREDSLGKVSPLILDVTDTSGVAAAVNDVAGATGERGVAGVVNNAGVADFGPVEQTSKAAINHQFDVNVFGVLDVTQQFLPLLRKGKGRIVNVSSVNGRLSMPFSGIYSATKFALEAISDALRMELKPWGISVSVVEPGLISTNIRHLGMEDWTRSRERMPEATRELYEDVYQGISGLIEELEKNAASHECVSEAVHHALTSDTPQIRYEAGPDWENWKPLLSLSDEERDQAFQEMFG